MLGKTPVSTFQIVEEEGTGRIKESTLLVDF